jgi:hypothetical protein
MPGRQCPGYCPLRSNHQTKRERERLPGRFCNLRQSRSPCHSRGPRLPRNTQTRLAAQYSTRLLFLYLPRCHDVPMPGSLAKQREELRTPCLMRNACAGFALESPVQNRIAAVLTPFQERASFVRLAGGSGQPSAPTPTQARPAKVSDVGLRDPIRVPVQGALVYVGQKARSSPAASAPPSYAMLA